MILMDQNNTNHQFSIKDMSIPIGIVFSIILTVGSVVWSVSSQITELKVFLAENMATQAELAEVESRIIVIERNNAVIQYRIDQLEDEDENNQSE